MPCNVRESADRFWPLLVRGKQRRAGAESATTTTTTTTTLFFSRLAALRWPGTFKLQRGRRKTSCQASGTFLPALEIASASLGSLFGLQALAEVFQLSESECFFPQNFSGKTNVPRSPARREIVSRACDEKTGRVSEGSGKISQTILLDPSFTPSLASPSSSLPKFLRASLQPVAFNLLAKASRKLLWRRAASVGWIWPRSFLLTLAVRRVPPARAGSRRADLGQAEDSAGSLSVRGSGKGEKGIKCKDMEISLREREVEGGSVRALCFLVSFEVLSLRVCSSLTPLRLQVMIVVW